MSGSSKVLVTGATGFIGRALVEQAGDLELIGVARSAPPPRGRELANVEWIEADLSRPGFERALPGRVDAVINLARSERQHDFPEGALDVYEVNVAGAARLAEYARRSGAERFVLASTATVYRQGNELLDERAPLDCADMYPASKRSAELVLRSYAPVLPGVALRLFTPYGPHQQGQLIADLIRRVRAGEPIEVQGRRGLLMSPIHVADLASALLAALRIPLPTDAPFEVVNVGGPDQLGIRDVGEQIGETLGAEVRFTSREGPEPGGYLADRAKAQRLLDVSDPIPFREGLRRTIDAGAATAR